MSVFSTNQPTVSSSHYWLTSSGPDLQSSAKKGSNWDQQRVHWYLIQEWPCPGLKHFNHALSQFASGNWFFMDRKRHPDTFGALHCFQRPLKLFWLSVSVDVPRYAGPRFEAAYLVQIYVTVETIATIKTSKQHCRGYWWIGMFDLNSKYIGQTQTWFSRIFFPFFSKYCN